MSAEGTVRFCWRCNATWWTTTPRDLVAVNRFCPDCLPRALPALSDNQLAAAIYRETPRPRP